MLGQKINDNLNRLCAYALTHLLYRKYRPQKFSDVVGQEHVVKTLQGALKSGRVGHAYLFSGSRGTGKTSLARIFAKALNCDDRKAKNSIEPCNDCHFCASANQGNLLDLVEIDAASNRGIDEIRNLKDSALIAAPSGRHKVFIIDEVHMLTKDAFNALLKILEEPPVHVVFILATTEPHKILPTVMSRVQRFDFKRLNRNQISEKINKMAKQEGIKINEDAITTIAMFADGALRDAEVALSKVQSSSQSSKEITADEVNEMLGLVSYKYYPEFVNLVLNNDRSGAMELLQKIYLSGADMENFTGKLIEYLRKALMARINPAILVSSGEANDEEIKNMSALSQKTDGNKLTKLILSFSNARNEIKHSPVPQLPLELAVIELTQLEK